MQKIDKNYTFLFFCIIKIIALNKNMWTLSSFGDFIRKYNIQNKLHELQMKIDSIQEKYSDKNYYKLPKEERMNNKKLLLEYLRNQKTLNDSFQDNFS